MNELSEGMEAVINALSMYNRAKKAVKESEELLKGRIEELSADDLEKCKALGILEK